jgi:hypothetical protein
MRPVAPFEVAQILQLAAEKGYTTVPWPDHQEQGGLVGGWTISDADWIATVRTLDDQWTVLLSDSEGTSMSAPKAFYELMADGWLEDAGASNE